MITPQLKAKAKKVELIELYEEQFGPLKRFGGVFRGNCPIHNDEGTPNFTIYPETNTYHCFACGKSGDSIQFIVETKHKSFAEAIKELT